MPKKEWPPCQVCGKPVSTRQGILVVNYKELQQYESQQLEWEKKHPADVSGVITITPDLPDLVEWHWGHASCLPEGGYYIEYSKFDTIPKVLSWTLHLMESKRWLKFTDWERAVRVHHKVPHP